VLLQLCSHQMYAPPDAMPYMVPGLYGSPTCPALAFWHALNCTVIGFSCPCACALAAVFWGGPLWQVYHGLRTHACSVSVKGLRPATAAEIERMHHDCAICWCHMTVPGDGRQPGSAGQQQQQAAGHGSVTRQGSTDNSPVDTTSTAGDPGVAAKAGTAGLTDAEPPAVAGAGSSHAASAAGVGPSMQQAVPQAPLGLASAEARVRHAAAAVGVGEAGQAGIQAVLQQQQQAGELNDTDGCTLPCGHCYHPGCLTQVRADVAKLTLVHESHVRIAPLKCGFASAFLWCHFLQPRLVYT
jgi:hypothetical protein